MRGWENAAGSKQQQEHVPTIISGSVDVKVVSSVLTNKEVI